MPYNKNDITKELKDERTPFETTTNATTINPDYYYGTGGILLSDMIESEYKNGRIEISPFDKSKINPNSYNVTLSRHLKKYDIYRPSLSELSMFGGLGMVATPDYLKCIDARKNNRTVDFYIPDEGIILEPGVLYIGTTEEVIGSDYYIPIINGRSSIGRLGMCVHVTAGFGDIGFKGQWTLEISVIEPLKIYPDMEIAQIAFYSPVTRVDTSKFNLYKGRYQNQEGATTSRFYLGKNAKSSDAKLEETKPEVKVTPITVTDKIAIRDSTVSTIKIDENITEPALDYSSNSISNSIKEYIDQHRMDGVNNTITSPTPVKKNPFELKVKVRKEEVK